MFNRKFEENLLKVPWNKIILYMKGEKTKKLNKALEINECVLTTQFEVSL